MARLTCEEVRAKITLRGSAVSESGRRASIELREGETVQVYRTDHDAFREFFNLAREPVCDALFHIQDRDRSAVVFVELKGGHVAHAIKQLKTTIQASRRCIDDLTGTKPLYQAVVVCQGAAPKKYDRAIREFKSALGCGLRLCSRKELKLREFVP